MEFLVGSALQQAVKSGSSMLKGAENKKRDGIMLSTGSPVSRQYSVPNGGSKPRRQSVMLTLMCAIGSTIGNDHFIDFFSWNDDFSGEYIQADPEAAGAFRAHDSNCYISGAFCIYFAFMTKRADYLVSMSLR